MKLFAIRNFATGELVRDEDGKVIFSSNKQVAKQIAREVPGRYVISGPDHCKSYRQERKHATSDHAVG